MEKVKPNCDDCSKSCITATHECNRENFFFPHRLKTAIGKSDSLCFDTFEAFVDTLYKINYYDTTIYVAMGFHHSGLFARTEPIKAFVYCDYFNQYLLDNHRMYFNRGGVIDCGQYFIINIEDCWDYERTIEKCVKRMKSRIEVAEARRLKAVDKHKQRQQDLKCRQEEIDRTMERIKC